MFDHPVEADFVNMFCGEQLGSGVSRDTFRARLDPTCVIKIEKENCFQNVIEHETWDRIKYTELAKWFAPVVAISPCGRVLMQKYAKDLIVPPERLPAFFTDFSRENYGLIGKQVVARDYGFHLMLEKGMTNRMRKVRYWA